MKKPTLDDLYQATVSAYGRMPTDDQFNAWLGVLGQYTIEMVAKAILDWQGSTEEDSFTHKLRGAVMPTPADLKALVERSQRQAAQGNKFIPCNKRNILGKPDGQCMDGMYVFQQLRRDGVVRQVAGDCQCKEDWRALRPR